MIYSKKVMLQPIRVSGIVLCAAFILEQGRNLFDLNKNVNLLGLFIYPHCEIENIQKRKYAFSTLDNCNVG